MIYHSSSFDINMLVDVNRNTTKNIENVKKSLCKKSCKSYITWKAIGDGNKIPN